MPEKEEEGTNKALDVIPLFFFDLIARVVPGLFLLFGVKWICDWNPLREVFDHSELEEIGNSIFAQSAMALLAGYVIGHLISPFVKALDNWHKNADSFRATKSTLGFIPRCWSRLCPPLSDSKQGKADPNQPKSRTEMYDELRLLCPGVTNITMRIRAEYIMYGGFCFALLADLFLLLAIRLKHLGAFSLTGCIWSGIEALALLAGVVLIFYRNQETIETFNRTVKHFYDAAERVGRFHERLAPSVEKQP